LGERGAGNQSYSEELHGLKVAEARLVSTAVFAAEVGLMRLVAAPPDGVVVQRLA
jgi:hypothetical protein